MANKSFVFITGVLTLSIMGNAYGLDCCLEIKNTANSSRIHYAKKGYTIKPSGHGRCMHGVYNPYSYTALPYGPIGTIGIHYDASGWCAFQASTQSFEVVNNDTGNVVATFIWSIRASISHIKLKKDPENLMFVQDPHDPWPNRLNVETAVNWFVCHPWMSHSE